MSLTLIILLLLLLATFWLVSQIVGKKYSWLHFLLLIVSPWVLVLAISSPALKEIALTQSKFTQIQENLSFLTSAQFLFFRGDGRPGYSEGYSGVFLPSFLPVILIGMIKSLRAKTLIKKIPLWWLAIGLTISIVSSTVAGLPASLWFVPSMSVLATIGIVHLLGQFKQSRSTLVTKALVVFIFLWVLYEAVNLFHTIVTHQPFNQ